MNIEKLNLQEMSHQEMKETEGGFWWVALIIPALIIVFGIIISSDKTAP
jgi:lactobin A/cerein 7B family class IIb bacteriocin